MLLQSVVHDWTDKNLSTMLTHLEKEPYMQLSLRLLGNYLPQICFALKKESAVYLRRFSSKTSLYSILCEE